ncbi:hypothetical protein [Natrinema sp. 1APR25-10V2]|uniref:hypothetical protein n=1 Tax=Natrinema sp. 1APR25-10V2 TaxID=2951081 RepID=UPI00287704B8|nr:hypothetical protein [Natrinema sp. 1APR25-10V2]MDS0477081.1 hypothetical protein [Natrinema sp. 1APR25-10V2]
MSDSRPAILERDLAPRVIIWFGVLVALTLFLFAIRLLGTATEAFSDVVEWSLSRIVTDDLRHSASVGWRPTA